MPYFTPCVFCATCKQSFTGLVQLRLVIALWEKYARAVETDADRIGAVRMYAEHLGAAGEHAEAARLKRGVLDANTQTLQGTFAEAAVLLRTTLVVWIHKARADDKSTLLTAANLFGTLLELGKYAEAEELGRGTLEKIWRVFGPDRCQTLITAQNRAVSLSRQGKCAEAAEIQREALVQRTRLLGAEHEDALSIAFNLAASLWQCGK